MLPAADGTSVYIGGSFSSIGGQTRSNLARVRVSDGAVLTGFNAGTISGQVKDLRLTNGRLWVARRIHPRQRPCAEGTGHGQPDTGAFDGYMSAVIDGVHNGGNTTVGKIDVTPDGSRLIAIGNFETLNGVHNEQLFMLDLTGPSRPRRTARPTSTRPPARSPSTATCATSTSPRTASSSWSAPPVPTAAAIGACDTTARFETSCTGTGIEPSWVDYTGGDTTYAVEITDSVVYVGGHSAGRTTRSRATPPARARSPVRASPRWTRTTACRSPGTPPAPVESASSTSWSPTGLWVGSDTDRIGDYKYKGRIALLPAGRQRHPGDQDGRRCPTTSTSPAPAARPRTRARSTGSTPPATPAPPRASTGPRTPTPTPVRTTTASATGPATTRCRTWTPASRPARRGSSSTTSCGTPTRHAEHAAGTSRSPPAAAQVRLYFANRYSGTPRSASGCSTSTSTASGC